MTHSSRATGAGTPMVYPAGRPAPPIGAGTAGGGAAAAMGAPRKPGGGSPPPSMMTASASA